MTRAWLNRWVLSLITRKLGINYRSSYETDKEGKYKNEFSFFNELEDDKIVKLYYGDSVEKLLEISEREDM